MRPKPIKMFSRAAVMLLMMMLTTVTAWAGEVTVTYQVNFQHLNSSFYKTSLVRIDNPSLSATIADQNTAWPKNTGVCVNDEYDITFKPSQDLSIASNPGSSTAMGFTMSSGTTFTASVASNSSYYIKQVRLINVSIATATVTATT